MKLHVGKEVAALRRMSMDELHAKYAELFGEEAWTINNRVWLVKRIAWRMQAMAEGDLSERARRRAAELANDALGESGRCIRQGEPEGQRPGEPEFELNAIHEIPRESRGLVPHFTGEDPFDLAPALPRFVRSDYRDPLERAHQRMMRPPGSAARKKSRRG